MKAMFSEEYYRSHWEEMLTTAKGEYGINLDRELADKLESYKEAFKEMPKDAATQALEVIKAQVVKQIIETTTKLVLEEKAVVENIEAGKASFGYTTETQEVRARSDFRKRFEFNCLQLADFKKLHIAGEKSPA